MRTASTSLVIQAPIDKVWEVMTAIEQYPAWNPFIYEVKADALAPKVGGEMTFQVKFANGSTATSKERVNIFSPPQEGQSSTAEWSYVFEGILPALYCIQATRIQQLTPLPNGATQYFTSEAFRGWGQWLLPLKQVQQGFEIQAAALKKVCESQSF